MVNVASIYSAAILNLSPPSLLLFIGPPIDRNNDLYCSDSREPRAPHALGIQLSKIAESTGLMIMMRSFASFYRKLE